ncbi:hypothetical protein [Nonomuraea pusilla]|uniref:Uncharacterized protein n=1 Tax=Nonomuraea pusilla TaxID=46177 RepID=A0A1H7YUZ4_9ACTN|nr:hypothetical protein [Nonomuraea pusilla]SEM49684.1 hypothetical protein SAMN05660976_05276 [Nonomuraea pusilla]
MHSVIPAPWDVAAQTAIWEDMKRLSPRAYVQAVINIENRVGEAK